MTMKTLLPRRWRADEDQGFTTLQRAMNELLEDFVPTLELPALAGPVLSPAWMPRLDLVESDKEILVTIELPGLDEKNVDVTLVGDLLVIKGDKKAEIFEKGRTFHRSERTWGCFQRTVQLPCELDRKNIKAAFKQGVLEVTLPKAESAQRPVSKIEVKAG